jgi:hypothetical protein
MKNKTRKPIARNLVAARLNMAGVVRQALALTLSLAVAVSPAMAASNGVALLKAVRTYPSHAVRNVEYFIGGTGGVRQTSDDGGCHLQSARGDIKHVIYIQFDNVHFERDNPNVPSDLEQMPHLLNFLKQNGALLTNSHTPLISHTSVDILTSLTGVYGDRHGAPIGNSFGYYPLPGTSTAPDLFDSTFTYWTDPVSTATPSADPLPIMLAQDGKNAPAPWVAYTKAGCNFGAVSIANMEFENITNDIFTVFPDPNSPQNIEARNATTPALKATAVADFEGIAIHCALGSSLCSTANGGGPDLLPDEPNGYTGFNALYGHKYVVPAINNGSASLNDLDGNVITDASNPPNIGFPGFSGIDAAQTLGYVATMQEQGVPVTFAYISDVHDNPERVNLHAPAACLTDTETGGLGPGDVCHNALAASYDEAFDKFFTRLKADGIDPSNTLFAIMCEEQDHFAGGPPSPANCDGVNVPCTYQKLGEVDVNTTSLLDALDPTLTATPFDIHFDMAPVFYISGDPGQTAAITRQYERDTGKLTAVSPITGNTDNLTAAMADLTEMKILHMLTSDPQRNPSFVMFGNPDYFFQTTGSPAVAESPAFAYNHGGIQPEISTVWVGFVGPGVLNRGIDSNTFADETDYRPTMLSLLGLQDEYQHEGRVLSEELYPWALPKAVGEGRQQFEALAAALKQINAPFGQLGKDTLAISTVALNGNDAKDATYTQLENQLTNIGTARDAIAGQMLALLEAAEFNGQPITVREAAPLILEADLLLAYTHLLTQVSTKQK